MSLVDEALISVCAGNGGKGLASFHRTRSNPRGGPDGGNGGEGGSVFAESSGSIKTLRYLRYHPVLRAKNGGNGGSGEKHGRNGEDVVVQVPPGTLIRDGETRHLHADLNAGEMRVLLARGGRGGFGNAHFKSSTNRRPTEFTDGFRGETRSFLLELRLLADIGIIGLPNAGKSSLLAALTRANPKIANYPFTTLEPNLGVMLDDRREVVVADIPGLIEGAVDGAGCGNKFLRHISRTRLLWHVVDVSAGATRDEIARDMRLVGRELELFEDGMLADKPRWIILNKIDSADRDLAGGVGTRLKSDASATHCFAVSALTGEGISELKRAAMACAHEPA